nr:MAG TPA: hypothetical protein [Caudoviricetes sp.]
MRVRTRGATPGLAGTTRGDEICGSASPGFCVRENEKKGLTI